MPALAAVAWALFLIFAFVVRTVLHRRRTGGSGFVGTKEPLLSLRGAGAVLFTVALVAGGAAPLLALAGVWPALGALDRPAVAWAGATMFAAGLLLTVWAQAAMGASWRIGVDPGARTQLVTAGPFRLVRNPIFTAMSLAAAGLALMVPSALSLGAIAALVVAIEIQVRLVEEPYLARVHGRAYLAYAARTGRFVPRLGRIGAARGSLDPVRAEG